MGSPEDHKDFGALHPQFWEARTATAFESCEPIILYHQLWFAVQKYILSTELCAHDVWCAAVVSSDGCRRIPIRSEVLRSAVLQSA